MVNKIRIPTVGGAYRHSNLAFNSQTCINMFPEKAEINANSESILRRCPGKSVYNSGIGNIRGVYVTSTNRFFVVRGEKLVEILTSTTQVERGTIYINNSIVAITDNGLQLAVADGSRIWVLNLTTNAFAEAVDPNEVAPINTPNLVTIDQYLFGFDPDNATIGQFSHSVLSDYNTWLAIDTYNAEGNPDKLVAMIANKSELWLFGEESYEVFYDAGGDNSSPGSPTWARINGSTGNIGCVSRGTVATMLNSVYWLGNTVEGGNMIYRSEGYDYSIISTKSISARINKIARKDDAVAYTTQVEGHFFYNITFPTGNKTFVYDATEGEWHEKQFRNSVGYSSRDKVLFSTSWADKVLVTNYDSGNVYELSEDIYTDAGETIVVERTFPFMSNKEELISNFALELKVAVGDALSTGQGSDPMLQLRWSDDGGRTWSNWRDKKIGKRGEYSTRVIFRQLGRFRNRTFNVRFSEPIKFSIQDATYITVG